MVDTLDTQNKIHDGNRRSKAGGIEYICSNKEANSPSSCDTAYGTSGIYYSVGTNPEMGIKEKVKDVHGSDSRQVDFIGELEKFLCGLAPENWSMFIESISCKS